MSSNGFYEKWSKGLLPEPMDPGTHSEFMIWYGFIEELRKKLRRKITRRI